MNKASPRITASCLRVCNLKLEFLLLCCGVTPVTLGRFIRLIWNQHGDQQTNDQAFSCVMRFRDLEGGKVRKGHPSLLPLSDATPVAPATAPSCPTRRRSSIQGSRLLGSTASPGQNADPTAAKRTRTSNEEKPCSRIGAPRIARVRTISDDKPSTLPQIKCKCCQVAIAMDNLRLSTECLFAACNFLDVGLVPKAVSTMPNQAH